MSRVVRSRPAVVELLLALVILFGTHLVWNKIFAAPEQTLSGTVESGELAVIEQSAGRLLPTSMFTRWSSDETAS